MNHRKRKKDKSKTVITKVTQNDKFILKTSGNSTSKTKFLFALLPFSSMLAVTICTKSMQLLFFILCSFQKYKRLSYLDA